MMTGGEKIRELRKAKGLTLRELARELDINFTYLSKIENMTEDGEGKPTIPSIKLLVTIAEVLNVHPDELLSYYKKPPTKVQDWARTKAFQEFYRASGSGEINAHEWRALSDYLKKLRNKRAHKGDSG